MKVIQQLMAEHEDVLLALALLERISAQVVGKKSQSPNHMQEVLGFFSGFVDARHHEKEEKILFPAMERYGVPRDGGPLGVMLDEHNEGRRAIREMSSLLSAYRHGDSSAGGALCLQVAEYRSMLTSHIYKENHILYPLAQRLLPEDVASDLWERFLVMERAGAERNEAYQMMLRTMKTLYLPEQGLFH